jgi:hypothetical protein
MLGKFKTIFANATAGGRARQFTLILSKCRASVIFFERDLVLGFA